MTLINLDQINRWQLKEIKNLIPAQLKGGDILFIIPPFAIREYSVLAPHILQAVAEDMGFKADFFYANVLLVSVIGKEIYDKISRLAFNLRWMKPGERLFARSAHGLPPLGKFPDSSADTTLRVGSRKQAVHVSDGKQDFDLNGLMQLEEVCTLFIEETVNAIASLGYKMVGCTSTLEQNNCTVALLNGIKRLDPEVLTLVGGANCESEMAEGIASLSSSIDYIFSGESEVVFRNFLENYRNGVLPGERIIQGAPLEDLDSLPLPRYESYFSQLRGFLGEDVPKNMVLAYETSRGCFRAGKGMCYFCGGTKESHRFRQKKEETVIRQLEELSRKYPVTNILMTDNIVPQSFYKNLLKQLEDKKEIPPIWYQENTNLDLKDLIHLKKARITSLLLGVEALSTGLLKLMNKGTVARKNLILLRNAQSVGIHSIWHLLWGFPGDKQEHYRETLELLPLLRHLPPPMEMVHLILARFSSYVDNPAKHNITNLRPLEIYRNVYPDSAQWEKLAYGFSGDYPCESHDDPSVVQAIVDEIEIWKQNQQRSVLAMLPCGPLYIVQDSREIPGTKDRHMLDFEQAREVMVYAPYSDSQYQQWAVSEKLGIVADGWYVPLITAAPQLLWAFEGES